MDFILTHLLQFCIIIQKYIINIETIYLNIHNSKEHSITNTVYYTFNFTSKFEICNE